MLEVELPHDVTSTYGVGRCLYRTFGAWPLPGLSWTPAYQATDSSDTDATEMKLVQVPTYGLKSHLDQCTRPKIVQTVGVLVVFFLSAAQMRLAFLDLNYRA